LVKRGNELLLVFERVCKVLEEPVAVELAGELGQLLATVLVQRVSLLVLQCAEAEGRAGVALVALNGRKRRGYFLRLLVPLLNSLLK